MAYPDVTLRTHITSHMSSGTSPDVVRVSRGLYRLADERDEAPSTDGRVSPVQSAGRPRIPRATRAKQNVEALIANFSDCLAAFEARRHLGRHNVGRRELRLLRRVEQGDLPRATANPDIVALGVLTNAELVTFATGGPPRAEAPMVLSDDVPFSLLLDEPEDVGAGAARLTAQWLEY